MIEYIGGVAIIIVIYYLAFKYFENQELFKSNLLSEYNYFMTNSSTFKKEMSNYNFDQDWKQISLLIEKCKSNPDVKREIKASMEESKSKEDKDKMKQGFIFSNLSILDKILEKDGVKISSDELVNRVLAIYIDEEIAAQFLVDLENHSCAIVSDKMYWLFIGSVKHPISGKSILFNEFKKLSQEQKRTWN